jgi:hypothetical protein
VRAPALQRKGARRDQDKPGLDAPGRAQPNPARPGLTQPYQVDTLRLKRGCKAGQYGRRCKHLTWALGYEEWGRRQQAAAGSSTASGMATLQEAFV